MTSDQRMLYVKSMYIQKKSKLFVCSMYVDVRLSAYSLSFNFNDRPVQLTASQIYF